MFPKKLYVVTGKGGVGKTMTAFALALHLQKHSTNKILYNSFDISADEKLCKSLNLNYLNLPIFESASEYIGLKLKNKSIERLIIKTPFFKALLNMLPALKNMITLGHMINFLEENHDTSIVIDAPSTGHLLTILESPKTFNSIL